MEYKNPKLTVDGIIFKGEEILLIKRKNPPFKDMWALPGGFVEYNEKTEDAVVREIFEETGLSTRVKSLLDVYSDPSRDPRGHTVSVVYILESDDEKVAAGDDASLAKFFNLDDLPKLAFDHKIIINDAIEKEC
jgi:8-oxo-dGTP diphosphatase